MWDLFMCTQARLEVRMETPYNEVYPEEREQNGKKTKDHHVGCFTTPPAYCKTIMNENGIDKPGYKRPRFLGIPVPI
jgi:hypothetical protein